MLDGASSLTKIARIKRFSSWFWPLLFISLSWAMLFPIASEPDEYYHAVYAAAIARGEIFLPVWYNNPSPIYGALVPGWIQSIRYDILAFSSISSRYRPSGLAYNVNSATARVPLKLEETTTDLAVLPPAPYFFYGLPTLYSSGPIAVFQMRIIAVIMTVVLLSYAMYLMAIFGKSKSLAVAFFLITPEVYSLGSYPNPNGAEIAGAFCLSVLTALVITSGVRVPNLIKRWMVVAALLSLIRTLSPLWVIIDALCFLIAMDKHTLISLFVKRSLVGFYIFLFLCGLSTGLWDLFYGHYTSPQYYYLITTYHLLPFYKQLLVGIGQLPTFLNQSFFSNAFLPNFSVLKIMWSILLSMIVLASIILLRWRYSLVVVFFSLIAVLVPSLLQAITSHTLGQWWNGRYSTMLYIQPAIVGALLAEESDFIRNSMKNVAARIRNAYRLLPIIAVVFSAIVLYDSLRIFMVGPKGSLWLFLKTDTPWASYPHGWQILWLGCFTVGATVYLYKLVRKTKSA